MTDNVYKPDYAVHPGEYLEEVLEARGIKKQDLAARLGISVKHVSQIINKKAPVSAERAVQLERILGIAANIWNNLNSNYALYTAQRDESKTLEKSKDWLHTFPIKSLVKLGYLPGLNDTDTRLKALLGFFGISSVEAWDSYYGELCQARCRKSPKFKSDINHFAAWLRAGELNAEKTAVAGFSREVFKEKLQAIRQLTLQTPDEFYTPMVEACAQAGVALVLLEEFDKIHISGATRWLTSDKALLMMSLRYGTNDHFWFTFFHEAGHVLLHGKKNIYVDEHERYNSTEEAEANEFAGDILVPAKEYKHFVAMNDFGELSIKKFAQQMGIHPGIVVGRLQHDDKLDYKYHNGLKVRFVLQVTKAA